MFFLQNYLKGNNSPTLMPKTSRPDLTP